MALWPVVLQVVAVMLLVVLLLVVLLLVVLRQPAPARPGPRPGPGRAAAFRDHVPGNAFAMIFDHGNAGRAMRRQPSVIKKNVTAAA